MRDVRDSIYFREAVCRKFDEQVRDCIPDGSATWLSFQRGALRLIEIT